MAQQKIIWTVLPAGIEPANSPHRGKRRVSIVVSPRLTPDTAAEQQLASFPEWLDWPATLAKQKFALEIGGTSVGLTPIASPKTAPNSAVWKRLFGPKLPVSGFEFKDMSAVNLRSFPVRNVLGFVRRHYRDISARAADGHPTLLPWRAADPALKNMLGEAGTRTIVQNFGHVSQEVMFPGFDRFHEESRKGDGRRPHEDFIDRRVFNSKSCIKAPVRLPGGEGRTQEFALRALPPDWEDPELLRSGAIAVSNPADRTPRADLMAQFSGPAEYALWQSERFYNRSHPTAAQRAMRRPDFVGGTAPVKAPRYDFHQRIASYGDHANLLRRLGLVIDCVLDSADAIEALLNAGAPAQGLMRLKLGAQAPHVPAGDTFPNTAWWSTKRRFVVRPRTDDNAGGLLKLDRANDSHATVHPREGSAFDVFQVDPDGAALKTVDFVLSAQRLVGKNLVRGADGQVTYTTGDRQPVAALRSGGLGVSRHGRAGQVATIAASAALNNGRIDTGGAAAAQVTLYAEDVLRGYRVDVRDSGSGRWKSLCQREVRYTALPRRSGDAAVDIPLPSDEGYVKGASTTGAEEAPDDQYLHETLFRWTGWSLAAPRPGRTIRDRIEPGTNLQTEEVVEVDDTAAASGNGLAVKVRAAKGSLPRLRFGHEYRVRARLVDLAGNSLALDDPDLGDDEQATDPLTYGRFEPIDPPPLVLARKLSEGESLERLVLRSNFDRGTIDYAKDIASDPTLAPLYASPDFEYTATADRHVVPPKSAQQQCELHGVFDFAIGGNDVDAVKKAYAIAARESGSLMHAVPGAQIELVTPASAAATATVQGPGAVMLPPEQADAARDRFAAGQYLIHREALVPVPYLADPACGGIALHDVPGIQKLVQGLPLQTLVPGLLGVVIDKGLRAALSPTKEHWVLLVDFDADPGDDPATDWPDDMRSLRLVLAEQPGEVDTPPCGPEHTAPDAPQWDLDARTLTLFLPKGHIARLRYASFAHDRLIDHFGLPRWHDANGAKKLRAEAMAGANWTMTPWRSLTLVHATQQPVCPPALLFASVMRQPGDPHADLIARQVRLHGPSTGKFEIVGEWEEWVDDPLNDDPAKPGPQRVTHRAQLAEIRLAENHRNLFILQDAVRAQNAFTPIGGQVVASSVADRPAVPGNRHEFGDTHFRFIRYHLRATTRFREYLPPKLYADADLITRDGPLVERDRVDILALPALGIEGDAGAPVLRVANAGPAGRPGVIVPSSAPPDVPEVIYTVPTFRWDRPAPSGTTVHSTRHGNGLRVYLDRPWFSSGDGELLGVVIRGDSTRFDAIEAALLPFVTQWGRDPVWDSGVPSAMSRVTDFPAAVADENVGLLEMPGTAVRVVGHRVHFDAQRKLWYGDIELNPGTTYMPFVRLALVRYQPNALSDAKISKVVLAEFAQVLPRRRAVLQRQRGGFSVNLHGPVPDRGPMRQFNAGGTAESPYADISFQPGIGQGSENGRNRVELVLQTRDPAIDSDLAWSDRAVLGSGPVGADTVVRKAALGNLAPTDAADDVPVVLPVDPQLTVRTRRGSTLRFDRTEARIAVGTTASAATAAASPSAAAAAATRVTPVSAASAASAAVTTRPVGDLITMVPSAPSVFIDPPVWALTVKQPTLPTDRPSRLMLREFERYYTDRTVPEVRAGKTLRRIVVEERLVYAEVFAVP